MINKPRIIDRVDRSEERYPPRVTAVQWILVAASVVIAALANEVVGYRFLALITEALAIINFVLLVVVAREALRTRVIGKVSLVASMLIFYWIEGLTLAAQPNPFSIPEGFPISASQFDQELISQALVYMAVFQLLLFVGYSIRPPIERPVSFLTSRTDSLSFDRSLIVFGLLICAVVPLLAFYDFDYDKIVAAILASRSGTDFDAPEPGLSQHLALLGLYGAALFFVYALKTSTWRRFWWLFLGATAALPFVTGGTRHLWLYITLPSVLILLRGFKGQLDKYRVIGLIGAGIVVLVVAQAQFVYRSVGWREVGSVPLQGLSQINTNGQLTALLFAEHLVPNEHEYFREAVEPYFLIHWVPRQLWPNKPVMESWLYYNESYVQGAAFNVTPSVIGQFHINWGLPGVMFIGAWLGFLTFIADRVLLLLNSDRQRATFVVVGMFYAFIISSFRFYSPIYFSYFLFGLVAMFLLTRRRVLWSNLVSMPRLSASVSPS